MNTVKHLTMVNMRHIAWTEVYGLIKDITHDTVFDYLENPVFTRTYALIKIDTWGQVETLI